MAPNGSIRNKMTIFTNGGLVVGNVGNQAAFTYDSTTDQWTSNKALNAPTYYGDGSNLTGIGSSYGNANVSNFLASGNDPTITSIQGDIVTLQLEVYNDTDVATYLPINTANVQGDYFFGNGAFLTGVAASYGNLQVEQLLAAGISSNVTTSANMNAAYFVGNGSLLTGLPASAGVQITTQDFTATAGQTLFDTNAYVVGYIQPYYNGVKLGAADFTATDGSTVTLTTPANAGDLVEFVTYQSGGVAGVKSITAGSGITVSQAQGNVTISATTVDTTNPTGAVIMFGATTAPAGYLLCDGSAVSRVTYGNLFAVIGSNFGNGDGSSTFNLPDYTNAFALGAGVFGLGATGGTADAVVVAHTHTASTGISDPGHSHGITDPGHAHETFAYVGSTGVGSGLGVSTPSALENPTTRLGTNGAGTGITVNSASTGVTASTTITSAGVSGANANLPPFVGINFIIKT